MTDLPADMPGPAKSLFVRSENIEKRYRHGRLLKYLGLSAIVIVLLFLLVLLWSIFSRGLPAFFQWQAQIELTYDEAILNPDGVTGDALPEALDDVSLRSGFERGIFAQSLRATVESAGIDVEGTVSDTWSREAQAVLEPAGITVLDDLLSGAGAGDVAGILGRSGNAIRTLQGALSAEDATLDSAAEAIAAAEAALTEAGLAEAAAAVSALDASDPAAAAQALEATGIGPALLEAATALRQAGGFEDQDLTALIFAANRRDVRDDLVANPDKLGTTETVRVPIDISVTRYLSGELDGLDRQGMPPGYDRAQLDIIDAMLAAGIIDRHFNWGFFTNTYSQSGEVAGIGPALLGSAYMMLVVLVFSLVFGVASSIYLEEFAPKNRFTNFIEINISNLAAVPSIVFGILGAAILFALRELGFGSSIRGTALLGGIVLSLMTLPTIVIATRAALKAVPPSIREAALGVGASKLQTVFHHVLPLAAPGILTGTIIGIAQALGETAPLLLIGLSVSTGADILSAPWNGGLLEQAQSMPTVVYLFAQNEDAPVRQGLAQAGIIVMLVMLFALNFLAIVLRRRFERRW